jgi:hypothetical protein
MVIASQTTPNNQMKRSEIMSKCIKLMSEEIDERDAFRGTFGRRYDAALLKLFKPTLTCLINEKFMGKYGAWATWIRYETLNGSPNIQHINVKLHQNDEPVTT